jgi:o-succinylbenzoate synthase
MEIPLLTRSVSYEKRVRRLEGASATLAYLIAAIEGGGWLTHRAQDRGATVGWRGCCDRRCARVVDYLKDWSVLMAQFEIVDVRWYPYRVPLQGRFTSAHEVLATREGIIVEVELREGILGVGECAPLPEFGGGTLEDALTALPAVARLLRGETLFSALAMFQEAHESIPAVTMCGLETALLDALGQFYRCSIATLLALPVLDKALDDLSLSAAGASVRDVVAVNAVIGAQSPLMAVSQAEAAVASGFACVKLKLTSDRHTAIALVEAVRTALGPIIHLRLDANESWDFTQARSILRACERFDIQYVEQPLSRHDLQGMSELRRLTSIPLAADEMLSDLISARRVLDAQAADVFIVKPQLAGGLRAGRQIIQEASARGVRCVVTSTIEAGVGVSSALQLAAASPEIDLECGLATLQMLADDLIEDDLPVWQGHMTVPMGVGLGVRLDRAALLAYRR